MTGILLIFLIFVSIAAFPPTPLSQKIVGGTPATKGEFPHIVQISWIGYKLCAGSIVNENWVVTAARCASATPSDFKLVAGEHEVNVDEGTEQYRDVSQIILHPNVNLSTYANNIALMKVSSPFTFDTYVGPVAIPNSSFTPADMLTVAGWGYTSCGSQPMPSTTLLKVDVPLIDLNACISAGSYPEGVICAGAQGKGFCQGDQGGPLMSDDTLAGIASWTLNWTDPGAYVDVSVYSDWIMSITE